jgi:hypothetical protein
MNKNLLRVLTIPERVRNIILFFIFKFDKWHISPSKNREYPMNIVNYINNLQNIYSVCEIGCGLGDTISRINVKNRIGYDKDDNILRAASWLHRRKANLKFEYFSFPDTILRANFDILIAVNWPHNFEPEIIKNKLIEYLTINLSDNGILIIDSINNPNYRYYHDFHKYFSQLNCVIQEIGSYRSCRKVLSIQKLNSRAKKSSGNIKEAI